MTLMCKCLSQQEKSTLIFSLGFLSGRLLIPLWGFLLNFSNDVNCTPDGLRFRSNLSLLLQCAVSGSQIKDFHDALQAVRMTGHATRESVVVCGEELSFLCLAASGVVFTLSARCRPLPGLAGSKARLTLFK